MGGFKVENTRIICFRTFLILFEKCVGGFKIKLNLVKIILFITSEMNLDITP
jgi:hypothetical protein